MKKKLLLLSRKAIYSMIRFIDESVLSRKTSIFILCYHSFLTDSWRWSVNIEEFKKQITYLLDNGYVPVALKDIENFLLGNKKLRHGSFALTIDDGYKDALQIADFLAEKNITPTVFVLSDRKRANRKELETSRELLTQEDITYLVQHGWMLGSHTATHPDLHALQDDRELAKEIIQAKKDLEREYRCSITYFSYPKGKYTEKIVRLVKKAGYTMACSMNDGYITKKTNILLLPRIGIDRTYGINEFKAVFLPSAIAFRKFIIDYLHFTL